MLANINKAVASQPQETSAAKSNRIEINLFVTLAKGGGMSAHENFTAEINAVWGKAAVVRWQAYYALRSPWYASLLCRAGEYHQQIKSNYISRRHRESTFMPFQPKAH